MAVRKIFLSYSRRDAALFAERLRTDLEAQGFVVWQDMRQITAGTPWEDQAKRAIQTADVLLALLTPQAVRQYGHDPDAPDLFDSTCLDEIYFARYSQPPIPIIPILVIPCQPPLSIFRLDRIDMTQWATSEDRYLQSLARLSRSIDAVTTGQPLPYRRWHRQLAILDSSEYAAQKRQGFVGRQWLFAAIAQWASDRPHEHLLAILGEPGVGKSAALSAFVDYHSAQVIAYHFCRAEYRDTINPGSWIQTMAGMIANTYTEYSEYLEQIHGEGKIDLPMLHDDPIKAFDLVIVRGLQLLPNPSDGVRYIVIDALDESLQWTKNPSIANILAYQVGYLPHWVRIIVTSRPTSEMQSFIEVAHVIDFRSYNFARSNSVDIEQYVESWLNLHDYKNKGYSDYQIENARQVIQESSQGNFLYVSQMTRSIDQGYYHLDDLPRFPVGLAKLYQLFFERRFAQVEYHNKCRSILEILAAAQEPLTETQISITIKMESDYNLFFALDLLSEFTRRQKDYRPDLLIERFESRNMVREWKGEILIPKVLSGELPNRESVFSIYHHSMIDWMTSSVSHKFRVSTQHGHLLLADMCWIEFSRGVRSMSLYSFKYLGLHLREAKQWERLISVVKEEKFIAALIETGFWDNFKDEMVAAIRSNDASMGFLREIRVISEFILSYSSWSISFRMTDPQRTISSDEVFQRALWIAVDALRLAYRIVNRNPDLITWLGELLMSESYFLKELIAEMRDRAHIFWMLLESTCHYGLYFLKVSGFNLEKELENWLEELGGNNAPSYKFD